LGEFSQYRKDEKPPKTKEKLELAAELATLQTKLRVQGRPQYTPPDGLGNTTLSVVKYLCVAKYAVNWIGTAQLEGLWSTLGDEEGKRAAALRAELERQQRIKVLLCV
jgi:hypothetical protein